MMQRQPTEIALLRLVAFAKNITDPRVFTLFPTEEDEATMKECFDYVARSSGRTKDELTAELRSLYGRM